MKRLHPEVKLAIGPAIEDGFYYDFDTPEPLLRDPAGRELEAEMRKICKEKLKLERFRAAPGRGHPVYGGEGRALKVELINDLPEDAVISFYKQGEFTDLCAGPHLDSTGRIKGAMPSSSLPVMPPIGAATPAGRPSSASTALPSPRRSSWTPIWPRSKRPSAGITENWARELGLFMLTGEGPGFPSSSPRA